MPTELARIERTTEAARPVATTAIVHAPYESEILSIEWQWWLITQSQYHRREVGVVDLGDIDA